jgi:ABC-2 type transport system permease protein
MAEAGVRPVRWPLWLLLRVNSLTALRRLRDMVRQSRLLTLVIVGFVLGYLGLAFELFAVGVRFVHRFPGLGDLLVERLLYLLFCFLFLLLLLSNLVISYGNLFRNRETAALLTLPVPTQTIFRWKFIESTLLASWGFVFLISPLLAAYGMVRGAPWHFYGFTVLMVGTFIILPGLAGAYCAVVLARHLGRRSVQVLVLAIVLGLVGLGAWWFRPMAGTDDLTETRTLAVLDQILYRTLFAEYPLLPSYWLSAGVQQWAEGALLLAGYYGLVLLSYVLFFSTLALTKLGRPFYEAASAVQSRGSLWAGWSWWQALRRRRSARLGVPSLVERLVARLGWVHPQQRALALKDLRTFWRDTSQWAQSVVLFGLLAVYILNLRHFAQQLGNPYWTDLVATLNLSACALNLATLTTRFVYPQFSLEGRRLWIVGLAPLGLERVVKTKYWLAASLSLIITLGLVLLSCHMLQLPWQRTLQFATAMTVMTFTLTALAVSLGVLYPNWKEDNPSKIVSGFGGALCLVLSFLYIVAAVALLSLGTPATESGGFPVGWRLGCLGGFLVLSAGLGLGPMRAALRRLRSLEI